MYNEHFGFAESPFNVTPDSRFFFVNPCYEEAFATLRYGIETRKGFVVITGEPGTGKTTLLKRLTSSLDSNVQAACIFDPHLTFIQLLRLTLGELGAPSSGKDRLTMMGQLYDHLVGQLEKNQIVCLMIDEAQNLSVEMLEELRLLSNLETDTDKLIQIVLVGQPEFEEKLERPELTQLKQRVALRCRLRPLEPSEVSSYIQSRLQTIHYTRSDLFDPESVELISIYAKGIPRLINLICDNALLICYTCNRGYIVAHDVTEAATELQLLPRKRFPTTEPVLNVADGTVDGFEEKNEANPNFSPGTAADPSGFQFPPLERERDSWTIREEGSQRLFDPLTASTDEPRPKRHKSRFAYAMSWLLILALGGGLLFYAARHEQLLIPDMRAYLEALRRFGEADNHSRPKLQTAETPMPKAERLAPVLPPDENVENAPEPAPMPTQSDIVPAPHNTADSEINVTPEAREKSTRQPTRIAEKNRITKQWPVGVRIANDQEIAEKKLEAEIYKAISDRAITGVEISYVSDGTVYLNGRVATPRQKLAAVRAALSVPGVKNVRDRIAID